MNNVCTVLSLHSNEYPSNRSKRMRRSERVSTADYVISYMYDLLNLRAASYW